MKKSFALYKSAVFSYLIDPLFYVASILTILFCDFRFFFVNKFFVAGLSSTDLRPFFNSVPYISILTLPLLVFRLRQFLIDDSIPISPFHKFFSLNLASFSTFAFPVLLLISIPICTCFFGDVDFSAVFTGFIGIFFYGFCALSTVLFFFSLSASFSSSILIPLIISPIFLAGLNFCHLLPLYFNLPPFLSFLCRKLSFAWHFDAFSKGILDSRNFAYYIILSFAFNLLSANSENIRLGKKTPCLSACFFALILANLSLSSSKLYFRIDMSKGHKFSVSKTSLKAIENLDSDLRITYFRSNELRELYPQTSDVADFLSDYSSQSKKITLSIEKADSDKMKSLGIQGQQIKNENGTKTEFITVYSAILLQYLEKSSLIPFTLSTNTLEYDLTQRLLQLESTKERKIYILAGNGRTIEESYVYAASWLSSRGFTTELLNDFNSTEVLKNLTSNDAIAIFGSANLTEEQSEYLQDAIKRGTKAFIATSPFSVPIEKEWKVTKNKNDPLISFLNSIGFAFENALVEDIACHPITMESSSDGSFDSQTEYATMNYPLWISLQPQLEAKQGATVFWASPISLYNGAKPLLQTSNLAWLQRSAEGAGEDESLFLTNPFTLPKTASQSGTNTGTYTVAAKKDNVVLIADQFFVSDLMTGFISGETSGDFRNFDFMSKELLKLRGENELANLMEKFSPNTSLYKIIDATAFEKEKEKTIFINFVLLPTIVTVLFASVTIRRKRK